MGWGFCQVEINLKIREKLGSGWVGDSSPSSDCYSFLDFFFVILCCFLLLYMFPMLKKKIG